MAETTESTRVADEDTISLIDLVAVVLKRRRLIIMSTVCAVAASLAVFLLYPGYKYAKAEKEQVVEASTTFMLSSALKAILGEGESTNYINQALSDPVNILAAMRTAGYIKLDDNTRIDAGSNAEQTMYAIRRRVLQNKSVSGEILKPEQALYKSALVNGVGSITFYDKDSIRAKIFLETLVKTIDSSITDYIRPYAQSKLDAYENLLLIEKPSELVGITIVQGYETYSLIKNYLMEKRSPVTILRPPFVLKAQISLEAIQNNILKKAIILVFGVFFMAVFAAFVLQYVDTVKKDPESMNKLRDALSKR